MPLNEEQILALAPDEPSKKSGKALANASSWVSKGVNENALWGECQGSSSKPYQTQVSLTDIAFKCSCPSRKFPCKHGLGLLLFHSRQPGNFKESQMPPWVEEWITRRSEKQEKQAEKKDKPVDADAQAKRQASREQKVTDGLNELLLWIKDIIRNGILPIPEKGASFFEAIARRMVDAQAPGMAAMVRSLGNIHYYKDGWQTLFIDQLARIFLVIRGYQNAGSINSLLLEDVKSFIGFTQSQDELKLQQGITDTWLVLGKQTTEEDNLAVERCWLWGTTNKKYALVMQFLFRGQGGQLSFMPGLYIDAELVFYPSAFPIRAVVKNYTNSPLLPTIAGLNCWQDVTADETIQASILPFYNERPHVIEHLTPIKHNNKWWLKDKQNNMMAVKDDYKGIWQLLSYSGGRPLNIALIGKENSYEPLGVWHNNLYKPI